MTSPLADRLRRLSPAKRERLFALLARVPGALSDIRYDWPQFWARGDQLVEPSELERHGLIVFGGPRGCGKTRAAVELYNREILSGRATRPRLFAANEADVDKAVVHGESGILPSLPREFRPQFIRNEGPAGVLRYRVHGAIVEAICFSAKAPEGAVSHQGDVDLYDDVAKWGTSAGTAWGHARISCRIGVACGIVATTRRGTTLLRKLLKGNLAGVLIRRPADPRANRLNLAAKYFRQISAELDGTDLLAQELDDEELSPASPFHDVEFAGLRVPRLPPDIVRTAVWIDPATSSASWSCDVGVVGVAIDARGCVYGVSDRSAVMNAGRWPGVAWDLFETLALVAPCHFGVEINKGGNMGPELLRQEEKIRRLRRNKPGVSVVEIRETKATKAKTQRAGPPAQLAKNGQLKMLPGLHAVERQLRELVDDESVKADRADAFVHGILDLAELGGAVADASEGFDGLDEANRTFDPTGYDPFEQRPRRLPRPGDESSGDGEDYAF